MKVWELTKGDLWYTGDMVYEFIKMDGMYGQWKDGEGNIRIGHQDNYKFNKGTKMYE